MNDDLTGQRLGSALRDHVPSTPQSPFGLDDVRGRARGMRRRRTLAGAAAGALATVVAATTVGPTALTALQGDDATVLPPAVQSIEPTPRGDVLLTGDEPRGEDAAGWHDAVSLPGAIGYEVPDDAWQKPAVARLGDQHWVVSHQERGTTTVRLFTEGGQLGQWRATEGSTAVAGGGDVVAFVDRTTDELTLLGADGGEWTTRTLASVPEGAAVTDLSGDGCLDGSDCQVLLGFGYERAPLLVDGAGEVTELDAFAATAVHGDLLAVQDAPALDDHGEMEEAPCTRVLDGAEELWSSCDLRVVRFSPDRRWAVVGDAYQSGWGAPRLGIADATTGELFFWMDPDSESAGVGDVAWEDAEHVVLSTWSPSNQEWNLFRVSLTGEVEQAGDPVEGEEGDFPFFPPID